MRSIGIPLVVSVRGPPSGEIQNAAEEPAAPAPMISTRFGIVCVSGTSGGAIGGVDTQRIDRQSTAKRNARVIYKEDVSEHRTLSWSMARSTCRCRDRDISGSESGLVYSMLTWTNDSNRFEKGYIEVCGVMYECGVSRVAAWGCVPVTALGLRGKCLSWKSPRKRQPSVSGGC